MREIDLNLLLYVLPPYHAYDQSPYPKRGGIRLLECNSRNLFYLMVGFDRGYPWFDHLVGSNRVRFTNHRKKIIMCFLAF